MENLQIKNFRSKKDDSVLHIFTHPKFILKSRIAAFDLDHTLIRPKGSNKTKKFPKHKDDWIWTDKRWPSIIQNLNNSHSIVLFTNQAGIARNIVKLPDLHYKINNVCKELGVPIEMYISPCKDKFRKPNDGMWKFMKHFHRKDNVVIDTTNSFYVGDAAGRSSDFSDSDQMFALNVGITFYTPENFIRHYSIKKYLTINPELVIIGNLDDEYTVCHNFYKTELELSGYKLKITDDDIIQGLKDTESIVVICSGKSESDINNIINNAKKYGIKTKVLTNIQSHMDPILPSQFDCKIILP